MPSLRTARILVAFMLYAMSHFVHADDWITNYYEHPTPERFVAEVRGWSAAGRLSGEKSLAFAVFLGRVMASNGSQISAWLDQVGDLKGHDRTTLLLAIAVSNTPEGRSYLAAQPDGAKFADKPIDIRTVEVKSPFVLDALWFDYFATGESEAIRRIVSALNYEKYSEAINQGKKPDLTQPGAKESVMLGMSFLAARWSLASNAKQHRRVGEILERMFFGGELTQSETVWVSAILAQALPDKFELKLRPGEATLIRKRQ
jgi:hypothetical protein